MALVPLHVGTKETFAVPFACQQRTTVGFRVPLANKISYASIAQVNYCIDQCLHHRRLISSLALLPFKQRVKFAKRSRASTAVEGVRNAVTASTVTTVQG